VVVKRIVYSIRRAEVAERRSARAAVPTPAHSSDHGFKPGLRCRQHVGSNFPELDLEFKARREVAAAPARHFPMRANLTNVGLPREVEQQRVLTAIELLRKRHQRFRGPGLAVSRAVDADVERLLLDHARDLEREQKHAMSGGGDVHRRAVAFGGHQRFGRDEKCFHHGAHCSKARRTRSVFRVTAFEDAVPKTPVIPAPEGRLIIARRFSAGKRGNTEQVPEGRLKVLG
jgi:hypothetical protein